VTALDLDFWSPALAAALRSEYDDEPDCPSRLYVPAGSLSLGPLGCTVDHRAAGQGWLHATVLAGRAVEWTSAEAEASRVAYLATAPAGPQCTECPRSVKCGALCGYHRGAEQASDNIETTEVEAA
jgi:hypothetical protein